MPSDSKLLAKEQLARYEELFSKRRAERDSDFQFIAQYFLPQESDIITFKIEGVASWTDRIFDTTGIHAAETLAAGLFNWWTPQNQNWAEWKVPQELDTNDNDIDEAVQWLGEGSDAFMTELGRSNFYAVKAIGDLGLAVFGTDLILFDESEKNTELFNFIHVKLGTYVIEENYKGMVDTVRRVIPMTYRQIKQKFGKKGDTIPKKMVEIGENETGPMREFKILHCIFPREDSDRLPGAKDGPNKPFASVYIAMDFNETIRVSGYDESPILCRRFKKWVTQWGYGPGYLALPDARQVNYVQQYMDAMAEIHAYPRVLVPDNLSGDVDLRAGGTTTYDSSSPNNKPEEWLTGADYKLGLEMQEGRRQAIRDAFYVDAFKLLNSPPLLDKEMTAFEISQRQAEQLQNITAVDARQIVEFINPICNRGFSVMFRANKLGQPPAALFKDLGGGKSGLVVPEVVVTSRFNDAIRALKNRGIDETFKFLEPIVQVKPEVMDVFDLDKVIRQYALDSGMAPDLIRSQKGKNGVDNIRAARAQAQAQQRALEQAQLASQSAANLGKAPQAMQEAATQQLGGQQQPPGQQRAA